MTPSTVTPNTSTPGNPSSSNPSSSAADRRRSSDDRRSALTAVRQAVQQRSATAALVTALLIGATACSSSAETASGDGINAVVDESSLVDADTSASTFWDTSMVHSIEVEFDQDDYDDMIAEFAETSEKSWISATVTIDGETYHDVGLRLKGNSSLFGLTSETAQSPEELPWLIRLDKFIDHQSHDGWYDIVIRSNSTETALNEAVAAELLGEAGLASEVAVATTLQVNDGATELRLAMQHPDGVWEDANFDSDDAALYKAESTGDYTYRGDDPDAYDDVFDQESGDDDLEPLIDFLEFINNTDDETFAAELPDHLDVEAFATYLAFQDLVGNGDDIDGRGNNSYLHYSYDTETFTVVNWDLNLAFGTANVNAGGGAGRDAGGPVPPGLGNDADGANPGAGARPDAVPGGGARPGGAQPGGAQPGGAQPGGGSNVLSTRFLSIDEFAQMYTDASDELTETLFTSGTADDIVATWVEVLTGQDIVDSATVQADAAAIVAAFPGN